jgi:adenylosuccinate synthase
VSRIGIRATDIANLHDSSEWRIIEDASESKIKKLYGTTIDEDIKAQLKAFEDALLKVMPYVGDSSEFLNSAIDSGKRILFEGAQGTLLDIDHGTYPFVTSSNCVSAAASIGTGVPPTKLDSILGIAKAYLTRVGAGPFPTELEDKIGKMIRDKGAEYGTVTGRPRRCGWLDLVALRYTTKLNGTHYLAITKADVLTGINPLKVCVAYNIDGSEVRTVPANSTVYTRARPIYEEIEGWSELPKITQSPDCFNNLPDALHSYIRKLEKWTNSKVAILSLGPDRAETVVVPHAFPKGFMRV